jgi:peroxiredoxin Q/BCP
MAPDLEATAHDGRKVSFAELRGKKLVVLYFYPKDFTSICTAESCGFRDMYSTLAAADVEVVGVSLDSKESHRRFAERYKLPFPLVSDKTKELTQKFGALSTIRSFLGIARRLTYVIDKEGKIAGVFEGELSASPHLEGVRALIRKLSAQAPLVRP